MADETYLNELVTLETDPLARALLGEFAKIIRNPSVNSIDYSQHMRIVMESLFRELANALNQANHP
jgi:hypothetical protein